MYYKAVLNLNRPLEDKIPEENDILEKMSNDGRFPNPPITYAVYETALATQKAAQAAAQQGGTSKTAAMRSAELVVDNIIRKYKLYVNSIADGSTDIILASGFRHTKTRQAAGAMPQVKKVQDGDAKKSGVLKVRWSPIKNRSFYEVFFRQKGDDTTKWDVKAVKPSTISLSGLTSLKYYEVKVRAKGTAGYGPFSEVVIILVT